MTALSDIQAQLDQTSGIIDGFRRTIADGALIDLTGLDQGVEEMCGAIAKLPADQRPSAWASRGELDRRSDAGRVPGHHPPSRQQLGCDVRGHEAKMTSVVGGIRVNTGQRSKSHRHHFYSICNGDRR